MTPILTLSACHDFAEFRERTASSESCCEMLCCPEATWVWSRDMEACWEELQSGGWWGVAGGEEVFGEWKLVQLISSPTGHHIMTRVSLSRKHVRHYTPNIRP
jgi:hypothetical protein